MAFPIVEEPKFYMVQTYSRSTESFVVGGVFTKEEDAIELNDKFKASDIHANVGCIQHLPMSMIIDVLIEDRLGELAKPLLLLTANS